MATTTIYNPLLKRNFQEVADTDAVEAEIEDLRQHKITKCLTAADLDGVTEGEIFQWQSADTSDPAELVNGYFYKKHFLPATQQVLILYRPYDYIGGTFLADTYYYQNSENPNLSEYYATRSLDNKGILWISNESAPDIGDIVTVGSFDTDQTFVTIVNREIVDLHFVYTDSNGDTWTIINTVVGRQITYNYYTNQQGVTINVNWNNFFDYMGFVCFDNGKPYLVKWTTYGETGAKFDTVINPEGSATYTQTNSQPPTPGITEENGTLKVSFPVQFEDDITVKGTQTVVHVEDIQSENDYITLRADNPLALGANELSGITVNNYDGNGTDCVLAVDANGWARVGDSNGTLQKLATIEESPADGSFVQYDATTKELKTAAIPEATTTAAGLMSVDDKKQLNFTHISSGSVNDILESGYYYTYGGSGGSTDANNISDKPTNISGGFFMKVLKFNNYIYQHYVHYNGNEFSRMIFTETNPPVFGTWKTLTNI